ncbi:hypothetical protein LTR37_000587 [Vermiconidia calcicola]|uniref:Uncharacterized protein n=1 Tax=Vermiconidia calcicola TaxID=1690605 RepID=A0ACC3NZB9_9PEZI|nr:hypothetical protein LTR37_000587 [Vermiconidia calcicola]
MPFTIEQAIPEHAAAIAKIFLSDETSDFLRLQLGTVDPAILNGGLTERLAVSIKRPRETYIIARDDETQEIVSYAQWILPRDAMDVVVGQTVDEQVHETEQYRRTLLPGMNEALVMDFRKRIREMKNDVLKGRRYYLLGNLGTLPWYRGRGAASALSRWPLSEADKECILVYLDTDQEGSARRMYEKLGFERVGEAIFDLSRYGGEGMHTHVAMIREPSWSGG